MPHKTNLLDFDLNQMRGFMLGMDEKPFRAQQLLQWIHQYGTTDFNNMTNLSQSLRARLNELAEIRLPEIVQHQKSGDGTCKWLLKLECGNCIETVFIPEGKRGTLCVSSQIGCALNCRFCSTGKQGFNRNLSTAEIIGQVWLAKQALLAEVPPNHITNVVMMGMGEPLLNYDKVVSAMNLMMDDYAYGLSKYRVTLSTSGVLPEMARLSEESPVSLAVSLHAANDTLRNILVPINKKYPLKALMAMCKRYFEREPKRKVTFEYVMLKGVNDSAQDAQQLVKLLHDVPAKVNLIPFNPFPYAEYECSSKEAIEAFRTILITKGIHTITRKTRGDDIDAACGQLAGNVQDRTSRSRRWQKLQFQPRAVQIGLKEH